MKKRCSQDLAPRGGQPRVPVHGASHSGGGSRVDGISHFLEQRLWQWLWPLPWQLEPLWFSRSSPGAGMSHETLGSSRLFTQEGDSVPGGPAVGTKTATRPPFVSSHPTGICVARGSAVCSCRASGAAGGRVEVLECARSQV